MYVCLIMQFHFCFLLFLQVKVKEIYKKKKLLTEIVEGSLGEDVDGIDNTREITKKSQNQTDPKFRLKNHKSAPNISIYLQLIEVIFIRTMNKNYIKILSIKHTQYVM